jgi:phage-related holin
MISTKYTLAIGWALAPLALYFEKYIFSDWQFAVSLAVLITCDTLLGVALAWKRHDLNSLELGRVFQKVLVYGVLLVSTHTVATFRVDGHVNDLLTWVDSVIFSAIMAREFFGLLEKTTALGIFTPPALLMKRFRDFDSETGSYTPAATPAQPDLRASR